MDREHGQAPDQREQQPDAPIAPLGAEALYRTLVEQIPAATYLWDVSRGVDHPTLWVSSRLPEPRRYSTF